MITWYKKLQQFVDKITIELLKLHKIQQKMFDFENNDTINSNPKKREHTVAWPICLSRAVENEFLFATSRVISRKPKSRSSIENSSLINQ